MQLSCTGTVPTLVIDDAKLPDVNDDASSNTDTNDASAHGKLHAVTSSVGEVWAVKKRPWALHDIRTGKHADFWYLLFISFFFPFSSRSSLFVL